MSVAFGVTAGPSAREALGARQREVLDALVRGSVPVGFEDAGIRLTARVLIRKRVAAAFDVAPELSLLPRARARLAAWAGRTPKQGCAHDDVAAFVATLGADPWIRIRDVYVGRRRFALRRAPFTAVVGAGESVWVIGGRAAGREGGS